MEVKQVDYRTFNNHEFKIVEGNDFKTSIKINRFDVDKIKKGCSCTSAKIVGDRLVIEIKSDEIDKVKDIVPKKIYDAGRRMYEKSVTITLIYKDRQKQHFKIKLLVYEPSISK
jgi:hypothetical protein